LANRKRKQLERSINGVICCRIRTSAAELFSIELSKGVDDTEHEQPAAFCQHRLVPSQPHETTEHGATITK